MCINSYLVFGIIFTLFIGDIYSNGGVYLGIVSLEKLSSGECSDDSGSTYTHNQTYTLSSGSCDRNDCYHDTVNSGKYVVKYRCRELETLENPDTTNCRMTSATSSNVNPFPSCCPILKCDDRPPETTVIPPACRDESGSSACNIWKDLGGCLPADDHLYNITLSYCRKTCAFCT